MMKKKNIMTDLMFQGSFIIVANGDMTRIRYSGEKKTGRGTGSV